MSLNRVFSGWLALLALGQVTGAALFDAPTRENYVRRSAAKATVLGDYVYVDGGEISQLEGGKIGDRISNPVNSTISIDISKSWAPSNVEIRTIPKAPGPSKQNVHLWTDTKGGTFYSWGGKWYLGLNMTKTELWKFTADGKGGGSWSAQTPGNPSRFTTLIPGEFSAVANTEKTGYLIGGTASGWTEIYRAKTQVLAGMLTFNMESKIWENGTDGVSPFNTLTGGQAQFVPTFGQNGLIMVMGGWSPRVDAEPDIMASTTTISDFKNLTFFDPESKKAYWQMTSGDIPPSPRSRFCLTGFQNPDGGYDIFLFGGMNQVSKLTYSDAYVLSLPGFVWTKLPESSAGPRAEQTCVAVGNRQVLSIGGSNLYSKQWTDPDPAPQGLLLFDMTAMKWVDSYDAKAAAYQTPDAIKSWYSKNSLDSIQWSSDEVKKLFSAATSSPGNSNPDSSNTDTAGSSGTPVGAIAGGVVGGVLGIAAIAALAWFLVRRKRQRQSNITQYVQAPGGSAPVEASGDSKYMYGGPQEVGGQNHHELYGEAGTPGYKAEQRTHQELDGGNGPDFRPVELDGTGTGGR